MFTILTTSATLRAFGYVEETCREIDRLSSKPCKTKRECEAVLDRISELSRAAIKRAGEF